MFLLIFAGSLWSAFVAWDLLGFSSLWLVVFLRSRASLHGGLITGLTNRLGDCFFFLALSLSILNGSMPAPLFVLLCLAGITKSALVPFSSWLPLAMCAPTPISSLVHSSTLVTAGIWLLLRAVSSPLPLLGTIGLITLCVGGLAALSCTDIKKIIAFSTLSHLGLMAAALGITLKSICFFHLICHGIIKASIFVCVGTIIHSSYSAQELRCLSSLCYGHPMLITLLTISLCSLSGLFFMTGFYSKHFFTEIYINSFSSVFSVLGLFCGLILSVAYSTRLLLSVFWGGFPPAEYGLGLPVLCSVPCIALSSCSVLAGFSLSWTVGVLPSCLGATEVVPAFLLLPCGLCLGWWLQATALDSSLSQAAPLHSLTSTLLFGLPGLRSWSYVEVSSLPPLAWVGPHLGAVSRDWVLVSYLRPLLTSALLIYLYLLL